MRKFVYFIGLPLILFLGSCYRSTHYNHNPDPPIYDDTYYFTEDFNNNKNRWAFDDPINYAYGEVSGGTYKIEYLDDYYPAYYISQDFPFNYNDNFIIEAKIGSDNEMGLLFGFDDRKGAYGYSINIDYYGNFRMFDEGGNGYGDDVTEIYPYSTSSVVRDMGDWNTVRIRQRGTTWIVYINDYEVFRMPAQNLRGGGVGFVLAAFTQGEVDYLDISGYR